MSNPLKVLSLEIHNYRAIRQLDLEFRRADGSVLDKVLFIGPNGSGKTSLLEAIATLFGGEPALIPVESGSRITDPRSFGTSEWGLSGIFRDRLGRETIVPEGSGWRREDSRVFRFVESNEPSFEVVGGLGRRALVLASDETVEATRERIVNAFVQSALRKGARPSPDAVESIRRAWRLFETRTPELEILPESNAPGAKNLVVAHEREIPADIQSYDHARHEATRRTDIPLIVPLTELSAGQRLVMSLAGLLVFRDRPLDVLLMDEPEQHLHPDWLHKLPDAIRTLAPDAQLFFASHSPDFVQKFEADEVFVLGIGPTGDVACKRLSEHKDWPRMKGVLGVGEFWNSVGEKWVTEEPSTAKPEDSAS